MGSGCCKNEQKIVSKPDDFTSNYFKRLAQAAEQQRFINVAFLLLDIQAALVQALLN